MTISISERSLNGLASCSGCVSFSGLAAAQDFEFVVPETVPGMRVTEFARLLSDAGYYGQDGEAPPDTWNLDVANAFNRWWDEVVLGGAFGEIASPDSNYPEVYVTKDRLFVSVLGHVTNPDGTVGEDVMDLLIQFAGAEGDAYAIVLDIPYDPREATPGGGGESPGTVITQEPAPTPPKPPTRSRVAYAGVVGWGLVGVGVLAGAWYGFRKMLRKR